MKCPKCQFEIPDESAFCLKCGAKIELICPACGKSLPPIAEFCLKCGNNLTQPSETARKELSFDEKIEKIQKYLPKGLTDKILSQRDKIEGERKQVTVMFCDMQGSTGLIEKLGLEEAYNIMDKIYEILIHKVSDFEGTVNEMTGDGIMALFGAPIALENAPQRAIQSALAIHREIAKFNDQKKSEGFFSPIKMRIGIHTGPVVVGTLGNDLRVEFKAVGETVILASRMEEIAQAGTTNITEDTYRLTEGFFRFESLGEKQLKGKELSVKVYQVLAPSTRSTRFEVNAELGLTPFVGRERELELLLDSFERIKTGRGQAFSIVGEAGIGKTRLLYEFRKAVANENVTIREGRCLSYSQNEAYHPIIDVLKSHFNILEQDNDISVKEKIGKTLRTTDMDTSATFPYLLELLSVKESGVDVTLSPEKRKEHFINALKTITIKGAEIRPTILIIEDLHWIDKSSEEYLKHILDTIAGSKILLILTYRPEFIQTWGAKTYHNQVTLSRLSNRESLEMISDLMDSKEIDPVLQELILEKTEGVPFFIEELIKSLKDLKVIEKKENKYQLAKHIQEISIPSSIHDVIMARVDALPERAKELVQAGSAIEREFSYELIKNVLAMDQEELLSNLSRLKDLELIYERGIFPKSSYIFKHALTQEVIYNSVLKNRAKKLHEKIGHAIENLYSLRVEEFYEALAYHYSKSDNLEKAVRYLKLSGKKAFGSYSNHEAYNFYIEALEVLKKLPDSLEYKKAMIDVSLLIYNPSMLIGFSEGLLNILENGQKIAEEIKDTKSLISFYGNISRYYSYQGKPLEGINYIEPIYNVARNEKNIELMASLASPLITLYHNYGEYEKSSDIIDVILNLERTGNEYETFGLPYNVYSYLCTYYGFNQAFMGNFNDAKIYLDKGLIFAHTIKNINGLSISLALPKLATSFKF